MHTKTRTSEKHAGVCHSFTSLTKTENRSSSPHCYLCFIRFLFFSDGVYILLCLLLLSTFGNSHRGAKPKCSSSFYWRATPMLPSSLPPSSGDLKCLNLPISLPSPLGHCLVTSPMRYVLICSTRDAKPSVSCGHVEGQQGFFLCIILETTTGNFLCVL